MHVQRIPTNYVSHYVSHWSSDILTYDVSYRCANAVPNRALHKSHVDRQCELFVQQFWAQFASS